MEQNEVIEHQAIIKEINDNNYVAEILSIAGCASCQLKKVCSVSDIKEKSILVQKRNDIDVKIGDSVTIYIAQSKGLKAVFLGYVLPLLLVFCVLAIVFLITKNEGIAGLAALLVLVPYYTILYLLRKDIEKGYKFFIK